MPVTPNTAFKIGENSHDSVKMYLEDIFTVSANLSGIPAISFPTGFINGMPIGSQLLGNYFNEKMLLQIAHSFQLETDWHTRRPKQKE
jgi:aspartyl-tRNA(Asn)/glutamyl-tRNA(Gln) amidotransferase subunit A